MAGSGNTGNFGGFGNTGGGGTGGTGNSGGTGGCTSSFDCDDFNACTDDYCEGTTCVHDTISVDDFDACTTDSCDPSSGVSHVPVSVDDFDACTTDACNSSSGVTHTPISCDDFDPCTTDTCNASTGCVYTPVGGTGGTLFSEDFSDNSAGWTLGTEWEIGPAVSGCSSYPDPTTDTSPTSDNGIAGVVIGGCQSTTVHGYYYLTSPIINTASATTLTLKFNRWLKSDYTPYVKNVIEVYNGSTWATVWSTGSSSTSDSSWMPQSFDISAYKSSSMQIRFGQNVGSSGAIAKGSWSIDDVEITSGSSTCTP